jgi:hypothetical protein
MPHTDEEVNLCLRLLILNGGRLSRTCNQLAQQDFKITRETLRTWRDDLFPARFARLRIDLEPEVREGIAGQAMEIAYLAAEAEREYIEEARSKIGEVDANHLAKNVHNLANAKATNIQTAQLLRDRPTAIIENRSLEDMIGSLERLGVIKPTDDVVDGEAVEKRFS